MGGRQKVLHTKGIYYCHITRGQRAVPDIGVSGAGAHLVPAILHSRGTQTIPMEFPSPTRFAHDIAYRIALAEGDFHGKQVYHLHITRSVGQSCRSLPRPGKICKFANTDLVIPELTPGGASRLNFSISQL